ncbi:hypothetical protein RKD29_003220 [Streptomyces tendae]
MATIHVRDVPDDTTLGAELVTVDAKFAGAPHVRCGLINLRDG